MKSENGNAYGYLVHLNLLVTFLFIVIIAVAFLSTIGLRLPNVRLSKLFIAKHFNINKRTLNNWIDCFLPSELQNKIHNRKNIPIDIIAEVLEIFGSPEDFPVLNRKIIIELSEGNYHQFQRLVNHFGKQKNLPLDKLAAIRVFPPSFGEKIAEDFGLHPSDLESLNGK